MKYLLIAFLFVSLSAKAQKNQDSLAIVFQKENNRYADSLQQKVPIKEFREFLFDKVTAKKYGEFMQLYNEFLNARVMEWRSKKK